MREVVIAYDLGTGGIKSSVVSADGEILCSAFVSYQTYYSAGGWQEQAPEEWWDALIESTHRLLNKKRFRLSRYVRLPYPVIAWELFQ